MIGAALIDNAVRKVFGIADTVVPFYPTRIKGMTVTFENEYGQEVRSFFPGYSSREFMHETRAGQIFDMSDAKIRACESMQMLLPEYTSTHPIYASLADREQRWILRAKETKQLYDRRINKDLKHLDGLSITFSHVAKPEFFPGYTIVELESAIQKGDPFFDLSDNEERGLNALQAATSLDI